MPRTPAEHDRYILHLNHALSMEHALVDHLEKRAAMVTSPVVREQILRHRDQTIAHRETVTAIIKSLHGEPTSTKANVQAPITPGVVGKVMTALESEKEDRLLMEDLADYAVENYEDAVYSGLSLIAKQLGYPEHAAQFERIRGQEKEMADFIAAHQGDAVESAFPPELRAA